MEVDLLNEKFSIHIDKMGINPNNVLKVSNKNQF